MKKSLKSLAFICAVAVFLLSHQSLAQEKNIIYQETIPSGFMMEGIYATKLLIYNQGVAFESTGLPFGIVGFRISRFALGLGGAWYRLAIYEKAKDYKGKSTYTSLIFPIRAEISVFQSKKYAAEAYVTVGWGPGFTYDKEKEEYNGQSAEETEKNFIMGAFAGAGGRYFFGGGPFAMGLEFGWNGIFYRDESYSHTMDTTVTSWTNINNFYAAITGQFVFGR